MVSLRTWRARDGFTLIELLVVMAIIALLLSIVVPRYFHSVDRSKEAVLRQNLRTAVSLLDQAGWAIRDGKLLEHRSEAV